MKNKMFGLTNIGQTVFGMKFFYSEEVYQYSIYNRDEDNMQYVGKKPCPAWKQEIKDKIFDTIPGVDCIALANGSITLIHCWVLTPEELEEAMWSIVEPYLNEQSRNITEKAISKAKEKIAFSIVESQLSTPLLQAIDSL